MIDALSKKNSLLGLWLSALPQRPAAPERRVAERLTPETTRLWIDAILAAARPSTRRKGRRAAR